jgi:stage V sporulation protein T
MEKQFAAIRRMDDLGRVVLPKEIQRRFRMRSGEQVEIFMEGDAIILKKYSTVSRFEELAHACAKTLRESLERTVVVTDV